MSGGPDGGSVGFLVVGMGLARGGGRGAVGFVVTDCGHQEGPQQDFR